MRLNLGRRYARAASRPIKSKPGAGKFIDGSSQVGAGVLRHLYIKAPYRAYKGGGKK